MANFAVAASEEVIKKGTDLLERMANPKEKKGETLSRMLDIVAAQLDGEIIRQSGVDMQALEAALANIRNQFLAAASGKEEVLAKKEAQLQDLRNAKILAETELRKQLAEAQAARQEAEKAESDARQDAERSRNELNRANDTLEYLDALKKELAVCREKAAQCEELQNRLAEAETQVRELTRKLGEQKAEYEKANADLAKDHKTQIRELRAEADRRVSDALKDAALAQEKALTARERELSAASAERIRSMDCEIIRLQVEMEAMKAAGENQPQENPGEQEPGTDQNAPEEPLTEDGQYSIINDSECNEAE